MGHFWSVAKFALKFTCAKQSKNLKRYLWHITIWWVVKCDGFCCLDFELKNLILREIQNQNDQEKRSTYVNNFDMVWVG